MILRQRRTLELLFGAYCRLVHRPLPVFPRADEADLVSDVVEEVTRAPQGVIPRSQLVELYGAQFKMDLLPQDFSRARSEAIWQEGDHLIIGEYGENCRIAHLTPSSCVLNEYYRKVHGVRHIHAIQQYERRGEFLVATGDSKKVLDLWTTRGDSVEPIRRLINRLAGFTAAVRVNGQYYFGTDFSSRPNYIATLDGKRYFFPQKAYRLHVTDFHAFRDRYIVSFNVALAALGGRRTISLFDTVERKFIYCENWDWEDELPESLRRNTSPAA
jgi:hypothetical protein